MGFDDWIAALEKRHLADLRIQEVTRALRALSSAYVERRHTRLRCFSFGGQARRGGPLDSAGKRAAFALFYAPLHFLAATHVLRSIDGATQPPPSTIVEVGCGTGAAGAAWALAAGGSPAVTGLDRHPWALDEARWTYRTLGLKGSARQGDATRLPHLERGDAAIAAYVLNELPADARMRAEEQLFAAAARGARVLILEPIARGIAPWWNEAARRVVDAGGRADEWRFAIDLPPLLRTLDTAAGLNHRELTVRSLWLPGQSI
jgi:SAM-dependent methyltransferase